MIEIEIGHRYNLSQAWIIVTFAFDTHKLLFDDNILPPILGLVSW